MNQINPLQIGALLLVIIVFLFFKLSGIKHELYEAKEEYKVSEKMAVKLSSLKAVYANKKKTQRAFERILSQSSIKAAHLNIKREKKIIKITAASINTVALNSLMGKVLNGSYKITALNIKKLSETNAQFMMEIQW